MHTGREPNWADHRLRRRYKRHELRDQRDHLPRGGADRGRYDQACGPEHRHRPGGGVSAQRPSGSITTETAAGDDSTESPVIDDDAIETGEQTVEIVGNVRCVHDGRVYVGGETATVPVPVADEWVCARWATVS